MRKYPKQIIKLTNSSEIDNEVLLITSDIQSAIAECSYSVNQTQISRPLPTKILQEIAIKRNLRKDWQRTRNPAVKSILNAQITYIRNLQADHRQSEWDKFTCTLKFSDRSLYKLNRRLLHKKPAIAPLKSNTGHKIYDTLSKLELFANTIEEQFTTNSGTDLPEVRLSVEELNKYTSKSTFFTTPKEVWEIIKNLLSAKAPGYDNIPNTALKHLPAPTIIRLSNIFTACLRNTHFPKPWKTATIVMIPKPNKDHSLPYNYMLISLLSTF